MTSILVDETDMLATHTTEIPQKDGPTRMLVISPTTAGKYPVIQLQRGFMIPIEQYSQVSELLARYGYIGVIPETYRFLTASPQDEAGSLQLVWSYLFGGNLNTHLPNGVVSDTSSIILLGHSRGGQACFLASDQSEELRTSVKGLVAIDPIWDMFGRVGDFQSKLGFPILLMDAPDRGWIPGGTSIKFFSTLRLQPTASVELFSIPSMGHMDVVNSPLTFPLWLAERAFFPPQPFRTIEIQSWVTIIQHFIRQRVQQRDDPEDRFRKDIQKAKQENRYQVRGNIEIQ
eukprot:CAMPEP_0184685172 /NCGR_PEP_ID=MMETSP0312-20130426/17940_1 /TAXON_ID=31354 /ORGANISM="Compsopogon coeruleus, Strain SAG 36.94" /LENGTH=287 /DNA_ID=CAMNT_0027138999 /DNA_START=40 /DNA_END=903 /DNA_ORIENTATION=-